LATSRPHPTASGQVSAFADQEGCEVTASQQDPSLVRVDTPPHGHEALPAARSISGEVAAVEQPDADVRPPSPELPSASLQADGDILQHGEVTVQPGSGATTTASRQGAAASGLLPVVLVAAATHPGLDVPPAQMQPLLVAERQRTDRAHAALLVCSRQAARLAEQLAEVEARMADLNEELRDWRRSCLENHRELVKHRRAAAAVAASAGSLAGSSAGVGTMMVTWAATTTRGGKMR
jgi:hypothetical protein